MAVGDASGATPCCRYQGVNWRDKQQWHCNADESPYKESHYDGINVDPLEVLFVKVRDLSCLKQAYGSYGFLWPFPQSMRK